MSLPDWGSFAASGSLEDLKRFVAKGRALADSQAAHEDHTFDSLVLPWEELSESITRVWGPVGHLYNVSQYDHPKLREANEEGERLLASYGSDIGQHEGLYRAYLRYRDSSDYLTLDPERKRIVDENVKDFILSGVGLEAKDKVRLKAINERLAELSNAFSANIQGAQDAWEKHVTDPKVLEGVPIATLKQMEAQARSQGLDGYLMTIQQPVYIALIAHAKDRSLRQEIYMAYHTRASDIGPGDGRFDNTPLIEEILELRREKARILGFPDYNSYSLARKMAPSVRAVNEFLGVLEVGTKEKAKEEYLELVRYAQKKLGLEDLEPWDIAYVSEYLRKETLAVDHEALRDYFPEQKVFEGMFGLLEKIYGIRFTARDDVSRWRDDVRFFEVRGEDGSLIGGVYADLFARAGKRPGAWMDVTVDRITRPGGTQVPVAYFNCNFTVPSSGEDAMLRHDEVETVFHEFGHVLHHLLSEARYPSSGMGSVEWDGIEVPSQIMENWCWEKEMIRLLTAHKTTGKALPDEDIDRLLATRTFHIGLFLARQLVFGAFDWELHLASDGTKRTQELWEEIHARIIPFSIPHWVRVPNSFSHIFDGGYAAGYYSYLWAEVLALDIFSLFRVRGIFDRATGIRFRREVLAKGATRPLMEGVVALLGREPRTDALFEQYGIAKPN